MIEFIDVGLIDYDRAHSLQMELHSKVVADRSQSYIILCEHPTVITIGKFGKESNVLVSRKNVKVVRIERGGDVTLHNPGQLVGYIIRDISHTGIRPFVTSIENSIIKLLAEFGVDSFRRDGCVGIWTEKGKICSIGVAARRWVTFHGFALNVCNDISDFQMINPCGMKGCAITSIAQETGAKIQISDVVKAMGIKSTFGA